MTSEREKAQVGRTLHVVAGLEKQWQIPAAEAMSTEQVLEVICVLNDIPSSARPCQAAANAASCSSHFLLWPHNEPH